MCLSKCVCCVNKLFMQVCVLNGENSCWQCSREDHFMVICWLDSELSFECADALLVIPQSFSTSASGLWARIPEGQKEDSYDCAESSDLQPAPYEFAYTWWGICGLVVNKMGGSAWCQCSQVGSSYQRQLCENHDCRGTVEMKTLPCVWYPRYASQARDQFEQVYSLCKGWNLNMTHMWSYHCLKR